MNNETLKSILKNMRKSGVSRIFVDQIKELVIKYEGAFDLVLLWEEEVEEIEKLKIMLDIAEHIIEENNTL